MKATWIPIAVVAALTACASEDNIRSRVDADGDGADAADSADAVDALDSADTADTTPDTQTDSQADSEVATDSVVTPDTSADTTPDDTTTADTTPGDTVIGEWEVDPDAPWALGRPTLISGNQGMAEVGAPVLGAGGLAALVPARLAIGSLVIDQVLFPAPDEGGHAAIVGLSGDLLAPQVGPVVYLDGPLNAPETPWITVCDGLVYATVNETDGRASRLVRLSADLESIDIALFAALPGIGNSVRLGRPVCGGPGFVLTLDAIGGATFTAPNGSRAEFRAEQTANKTLILNGTRVFAENGAQTVSATSMRILHIAAGSGQDVFYVGESTVERVIGETTLMPGDQLVYHHDYAVSEGGSIASQGWFGSDDITLMATAPNGRFAIVWSDVIPGATPDDPESIETVVSVFNADGSRAWNKRAGTWAIDRVSFDAAGELQIAGRFRSLEAIGVATGAVGLEDAFLAVLAGADGARLRHAVLGVPGVGARIASAIFDAVGADECAAAGALAAVMIATGPTRAAIGVAADGQRCATDALTAGDGTLLLTPAGLTTSAVDFWLTLGGAALSSGHGTPWPPAQTLTGPIRGRFRSPL